MCRKGTVSGACAAVGWPRAACFSVQLPVPLSRVAAGRPCLSISRTKSQPAGAHHQTALLPPFTPLLCSRRVQPPALQRICLLLRREVLRARCTHVRSSAFSTAIDTILRVLRSTGSVFAGTTCHAAATLLLKPHSWHVVSLPLLACPVRCSHSKGDCWLKFTEAPASPEVGMACRQVVAELACKQGEGTHTHVLSQCSRP